MPFWKRTPSTVPSIRSNNLPIRNANQTRNAPVGAAPVAPVAVAPAAPAAVSADKLFQSRGDELFDQGDYSNAAFMYSEALKQQANNHMDYTLQAPLHMQIALALSLCSPPQLTQALSSVNTAIQINPAAGQAWKLKGDLLGRVNDARGAIEAFTHAIGILTGYEKVQAQQSLAQTRARIAATSEPTMASPTMNYPSPQPSEAHQAFRAEPSFHNSQVQQPRSPPEPSYPPPPVVVPPSSAGHLLQPSPLPSTFYSPSPPSPSPSNLTSSHHTSLSPRTSQYSPMPSPLASRPTSTTPALSVQTSQLPEVVQSPPTTDYSTSSSHPAPPIVPPKIAHSSSSTSFVYPPPPPAPRIQQNPPAQLHSQSSTPPPKSNQSSKISASDQVVSPLKTGIQALPPSPPLQNSNSFASFNVPPPVSAAAFPPSPPLQEVQFSSVSNVPPHSPIQSSQQGQSPEIAQPEPIPSSSPPIPLQQDQQDRQISASLSSVSSTGITEAKAQPTATNSPPIGSPSNVPTPPAVPSRRPIPASRPPAPPQSPGVPSPASPTLAPPPIPRAPTPNTMAQGEMLADELDIPTEAPPSYSSTIRANGTMTEMQLDNWERALAVNRQGALYLRPFTAEGQIDAVCILFWGKTYLESVLIDYSPEVAGHPSWEKYHVNTIKHPGTNFLDYDCETAASYDGYHTGTTSVIGYSEEYRLFQLTLKPQLQFFLEGLNAPPVMTLNAIVTRIQLLQSNPNLEDNTQLSLILGLPLSLTATTRTAIEDICMTFHRGQYIAPTRFIDFLATASFSRHIFGTAGVGLTNFLLHILLGAELALRLNKMGSRQKYPSIMKTTTSALVVIARQWMENVTMRRGLDGRYILIAANHTVQTEGLLRFAEAIAWPYMQEARENIESLYSKLTTQPAAVHEYLKDWLYGLVLPGKFFRQRILSCLVLVCPTTKHLGFAPDYTSGLVVGTKSYWPKRTVLGSVLGTKVGLKATCGWVGPVTAPANFQPGWVVLHARPVDFVRPVVDNLAETSLEILGFSEDEVNRDPPGFTRDLLDINKWKPPTELPERPQPEASTSQSDVRLGCMRLTEVSSLVALDRRFRASLDLILHGKRVTFVLYSNPLFVHVSKCQGASHPIHEKLVQRMFSGIVKAEDLKESAAIPSAETLMIIDATKPGEELMARAWCAETGRHAVVRRKGIGCFSCATSLASKRTGLGFNVLIWCP